MLVATSCVEARQFTGRHKRSPDFLRDSPPLGDSPRRRKDRNPRPLNPQFLSFRDMMVYLVLADGPVGSYNTRSIYIVRVHAAVL